LIVLKLSTLVAVGAGLLLATGVAAPAGPAKQTKQTRGFIESLAIDGSIVAYDVQGDQPHGPVCNRVYAWNLANSRVTRVSGRGTCNADSTSTGAGVAQLAVAGPRIAWIVNTGGNSESNDRLYASSAAASRERKLAAVRRTGDVDCVLAGRWLGGLVGSGGILDYNVWTTVAANPGDEGSCDTRVTAAALRRIATRSTSLVRSGLDTLVAADADGGRVAVLHTEGTVTLLSSSGTPLRTIGVEPAKEIALTGNRLVVLAKSRRIQVYSARTGQADAGRAVPAGAGHLEAADGVAVYAVGTKLHAFRLGSGRDTIAATAPKPLVDVAASSRAVVYAYDTFTRNRDIGTVVAIPTGKIG
jgi:hypothetical protein